MNVLDLEDQKFVKVKTIIHGHAICKHHNCRDVDNDN